MRKDNKEMLKREIQKHITADARRIDLLARLIMALLQVGTVSYAQLALALNAQVKVASNFKRLQRFFRQFRFAHRAYVQFVWQQFTDEQTVLVMDRTHWKFGRHHINVLMTSIAYRGTAIPLIWKLLGKAGDSSQQERISLMRAVLWFLSPQQKTNIYALTADREFIGYSWLQYLIDRNINFVICIRKDARVSQAGQTSPAYRVFATSHLRTLRKPHTVFGLSLYMSGQQLSGTEYLILISTLQGKTIWQLYGQRWQIELLFGCLKSRGFRFEDTHQQEDARINTMIFVLALTLCWAVKTGEWLLQQGYTMPIKNLKERKESLYSLFRIGLDQLKVLMLHHLDFKHLIPHLSCT
uniref:IS4 family transposase n=1 Tax=Roseihalotalea indica TaxID=2867963 RepID=A0AA49JID4_9BACT|nr:IS4 family transposase [Tunicatimonas sp. TK19036]